MAWPGLQEGLGQGGPRLKWAKGRFGSKNEEKVKVLRMEFSIVENLSGLQERIFKLSRGPQLHLGEKSKKLSIFIKFTDFSPFPLFGVPWAAVISLGSTLNAKVRHGEKRWIFGGDDVNRLPVQVMRNATTG